MNHEMNELNKLLALGGGCEQTEAGLLFPKEKVMVQGMYEVGINGHVVERIPNLVVTEGRNYIVGASMKGTTPIVSWYIALFSGDVTVLATWTAANFVANATEFTAYTEAARQAWTGGSVSAGAVDNSAAKATFTINADSQVIRGAAMVSASAKSASTGTLLGAAKFTSAKTLDTGETLDIGYSLSLTAA
jgi:hypothetical protein